MGLGFANGQVDERKRHRRVPGKAEQRPSKDALRQALTFSDSLVETAQAMILVLDPDGRVLQFNRYAREVTGWDSKSVTGRDWFTTFIPKRNRSEIRERFRSSFDGPAAHGSVNSILTRDKRILQVAWYDKVLKDESGQPVGLLAIGHDITDRFEAEAERRHDQQVLDAFFDQALLGLLWVCPQGRILRVNEAFLDLLDFSREECMGELVTRFHAAPEMGLDLLARLARQETLQHHREQLRCKDGSIRHVLIDANGLWAKQRLMHSCWFIRDITTQVELEAQMLSISEREQQRLGQDLHDDLCQRLATLEYLCHALQRELRAQHRSEARRAEEISKLLQETTTHARGLAGGLACIELQEEGLRGALRHLLQRTRKTFGISCRLHYAGLPANDFPHEIHLYRIAQEAVSNAVRHGRASRIDLQLKATSREIMLGIRDNGIGIQPQPGKGQGMGIHIMQHRAGVMGGSLAVQKLTGEGTQVVCRIARSFPVAHHIPAQS
jgi:two-component system sensor kinase FixL